MVVIEAEVEMLLASTVIPRNKEAQSKKMISLCDNP